MSARWLAATVAALLLPVAGCSQHNGWMLALRLAVEGGVEVVLALCPGDALEQVRVRRHVPDRPTYGPLIWKVTAERAVAGVPAVRIGEVPAGFREDLALSESRLGAATTIGVSIRTRRYDGASVSFAVADLVRDRLRAEMKPGVEQSLTEAEFRERAGRKCR